MDFAFNILLFFRWRSVRNESRCRDKPYSLTQHGRFWIWTRNVKVISELLLGQKLLFFLMPAREAKQSAGAWVIRDQVTLQLYRFTRNCLIFFTTHKTREAGYRKREIPSFALNLFVFSTEFLRNPNPVTGRASASWAVWSWTLKRIKHKTGRGSRAGMLQFRFIHNINIFLAIRCCSFKMLGELRPSHAPQEYPANPQGFPIVLFLEKV